MEGRKHTYKDMSFKINIDEQGFYDICKISLLEKNNYSS